MSTANQAFKIEDGVQITTGRGRPVISPLTKALTSMGVGQSLYPATRNQCTMARHTAKTKGFKVACRLEGDSFRIFKVAEQNQD